MSKLWMIAACLMVLSAGCVHRVSVDPVQIEPIYVTMEIRVKIDRQLSEFFRFEEEVGEKDGDRTPGEPGKE